MIKKWKVTPVSSKGKPAHVVRPESRSKDDAATPNHTSETIHIRTRKPRRHTTGDTKQSVENIRLAKQLVENMNGQAGPSDPSADPNTTLGRKQLISMLKQRYGSEMDSFRTSADHSEKERIRKERQRERDLRHNQRMSQDNREMINHGGVHHSPAMNGSRDHFSGTGSEGSDDSSHLGPSSQRRYITHNKTAKQHRIVRRSDSEEDGSHNGSVERLKTTTNILENCENMNQSKGVVFLQYTDDVKRVNLPATVSTLDTVKALFVTAFPDRISLQDFEEGAKVVYIKDMESSTYYMLEDVCEVSNRSFLKIHEKEPSKSGSQTLLANHTPPETNKSQTLQNTSIEFNQSFDDFKLVGSRETRENSLPVVTSSVIVNKPMHTQSSISEGHTQSSNPQGHTQSSNPPTQSKDTPSRVENITGSNQSSPALRNQMFTKTRTESTSSSTTQNKYDTKSRVHHPAASHVTLTNVQTHPVKRRMDSYTSNSSKTESVEDQLDDLTELLKCALDEEERHHAEMIECVNTKNPGKIDPAIMENIQKQNETLARKNTHPKHFQPMAMVMAQQESDRKKGEGPPVSPKPKMPHGSYSTYVKTTHNVTNKVTDSTDINNNENDKIGKLKISEEAKEGFITPPHKHYYDHNNIDTTDRVDGNTATEINTTPRKVIVKTESIKRPEIKNKPDIESRKVSEYDEAAMSEISDNLIDQIMDLELEVQQRASNKSSIRNRDRSSTGSTSSKSSTTCSSEKNFSNNQDPSYQQVPIVVHVEQQDGGIKDKSITDNNLSFKHIHQNTANTGENKTGNDPVTKDDEQTPNDSVFTNGPSSMQHIYASIQKVTELPTSSSVTTTFGNQIKSMSSREDTGGSNIRHQSSVTTPDFIELEDSARSVQCNLQSLRKELADMRKYHVDSARSFKADIQKKLLEFRKKAARVDDVLQQRLDVNNNIIFANEHPVRERRHRLTSDQLSYSKKMSDTEFRLKSLEGEMERVRVSVVNQKRVDDPHKLKDLHDELTQLTKGLAEIKNRFHGLHDMLKVVMPDEVKIIAGEERFLKEEPQKLEGLIGRCKVLSGTLFTLERLASVQIDAGDGHYPSHTKTQMPDYNNYGTNKGAASTSAASYNYHQSAQIENGFEDLKGKRSVRFSNKNP